MWRPAFTTHSCALPCQSLKRELPNDDEFLIRSLGHLVNIRVRVPVLNRCVPTPNITELIPSQVDKITNISRIFNSDDLRLAMLSLYKQLPSIGLLTLIAFGLTILLVVLLRYLAKIMVLLIIFLSCLGMIGNPYCLDGFKLRKVLNEY